MKALNKLLVNMGLFSVLSMLLLVPIMAVAFAGFTNKALEQTEVLSAQDKADDAEEHVELYNDVPVELEELIRKIEEEMYTQENGFRPATNPVNQ